MLLVDDAPRTNDLNERLLKHLGVAYRYLAANDGVDPWPPWKTSPPRRTPAPVLMMLDVKMPGMAFL